LTRTGGLTVETSLTWLGRLTGSPTEGDWRQLLDVYGPLLQAWLARAGVPAADHDDLTQEVFVVLVREVAGFDHRGPGAFRGWLRGILLNRVRDYFRGRAGRAVAAGGTAAGDRLEQLADPGSALSRLWDREHDEYVAARVLERVKVDFAATTWEAFARQVLEGRPARDVAAELGISRNAALVAKSRVLARVRAELAGLDD
jgi:RNA polymerase sigma-70 factor (ECF subfamily)